MAGFALSFAQPETPVLSRRTRAITGFALAAGLGVYGVTSLAGRVLMLTGLDEIPPALGRTALYWHTFFWDPVWIIGGVLLGLAVRRFATVIAPRAR